MLPSTITVTPSAVGQAITMEKVSEQNSETVYRGGYAAGTETRDLVMRVKHTMPIPSGANSKPGSSHLCKLTLNRINEEGDVYSTQDTWTVVKSTNQVTENKDGVENILGTILADAGFRTPFFSGHF